MAGVSLDPYKDLQGERMISPARSLNRKIQRLRRSWLPAIIQESLDMVGEKKTVPVLEKEEDITGRHLWEKQRRALPLKQSNAQRGEWEDKLF